MYSLTCMSSEQSIMKDKWMNIGYENDELLPYIEPEADLNDDIRIRKSISQLIYATNRNYMYICIEVQASHKHQMFYTIWSDTATCMVQCSHVYMHMWYHLISYMYNSWYGVKF